MDESLVAWIIWYEWIFWAMTTCMSISCDGGCVEMWIFTVLGRSWIEVWCRGGISEPYCWRPEFDMGKSEYIHHCIAESTRTPILSTRNTATELFLEPWAVGLVALRLAWAISNNLGTQASLQATGKSPHDSQQVNCPALKHHIHGQPPAKMPRGSGKLNSLSKVVESPTRGSRFSRTLVHSKALLDGAQKGERILVKR